MCTIHTVLVICHIYSVLLLCGEKWNTNCVHTWRKMRYVNDMTLGFHTLPFWFSRSRYWLVQVTDSRLLPIKTCSGVHLYHGESTAVVFPPIAMGSQLKSPPWWLIGKELSRHLIHGVDLHFPHLRIHLVNIETIVAQNQDLITQVSHHEHHWQNALLRWSPSSQKWEKKRFIIPGIQGGKNSKISGCLLVESWRNWKAK